MGDMLGLLACRGILVSFRSPSRSDAIVGGVAHVYIRQVIRLDYNLDPQRMIQFRLFRVE